MATEITEFTHPAMRYGGVVPIYQLPHNGHTSVPVGTVFTVATGTSMLMVQPGEDVHMETTADGSTPVPSGTTSMLLKAGQRYDFKVSKGMKLKGV
jgi:hypothetical protein